MNTHVVTYGEYLFRIRTHLNDRGYWTAEAEVFEGARAQEWVASDPIAPEWATEKEAIREIVERAYRCVAKDGEALDYV
jgi:hypothetical protein